MWIVGGLYTLLGAVCLAELGTMLPEAGGYYVYARRAFGDSGRLRGRLDRLAHLLRRARLRVDRHRRVRGRCSLPSLGGHEHGGRDPVARGLAALQLAGLRVSSRFQEITTVVKFAAFLAVVVAAMVFAPGIPSASRHGRRRRRRSSGLIVALQSVVITYGGWQSALYFSEEDRDPDRNLPRSMIGGVAAVIVVYLLVNLALLSVLPLGDLARSTLPAADAAQILLGGRGREIITMLSIVSLPPMLNAILMIGTRILFAMGRDGLLWRRAASVTARGTPGRRDAGDDGRGAGAHRDRHVSAAGRGGGVLPGRQLRRLLPRADRAAAAGAGPSAAVPRVGLSVVGRHRLWRRRRLSRRRRDRRYGQRRRRAGTAGAGIPHSRRASRFIAGERSHAVGD